MIKKKKIDSVHTEKLCLKGSGVNGKINRVLSRRILKIKFLLSRVFETEMNYFYSGFDLKTWGNKINKKLREDTRKKSNRYKKDQHGNWLLLQ